MLYLLKLVSLFIVLGILVIISILLIIKNYGKKYILKGTEILIKTDAIIVLGAGVRKDGNPSDILADRIKRGTEAHLCTQSSVILLTGEERDENYNEVKVMKNWILKKYSHKVKEKDILLDGRGYSTFESMYRAKYVFKIDKAIISTNEYHLPRALYIARKLGIEAYGVPSDFRPYDRMKKYKRREILAMLKDFFLVNVKCKKFYSNK